MKSLGFPNPAKNKHHHDQPNPAHTHHHDRLSPAPAPAHSSLSARALASSASHFFRHPLRINSGVSLASAYSADSRSLSQTGTSDSYSHSGESAPIHPYAAMVAAPVPVVSSRDSLDDDEQPCPVCLEPLSFSFRLPGEKPHIVPDCGHALHEVSPPASAARAGDLWL